MTDPSQLRKNILTTRNNLPREELLQKSDTIRQTVLNNKMIMSKNTFFVYVSFRSEVATFDLINDLLKAGKNVTVPITRTETKRLDAIRIKNLEEDLVPGYCDIPEPPESLCRTNKVDPSEIEVIILPGSVFDERGGRFGYGGGFYDRFVSAIPKSLRVGLAFELQIVERAPLQPHDELLDLIITEKRIIAGRKI
ncbi:5-formyltetrahydrofolate cyclo-ligase [Desulfomarina profundi]|uniref:5-formyltetrahydrofolate cyclo-ligase n=1 Tax=Desulfomarina profundi TaxID=2772557 RepID=A0A8D5JPA8_9BACT|nr:5-formyltetrahydrofolate cyclo-ligase [Desulfomarina profundi]BCL61085.1 5-formyltetrahydrofolate cyclo-ligase [Desulfomarina profundi]